MTLQLAYIVTAQAAVAPLPTQIADPGVWAQLGPMGGVLAFIVTALWLLREYQWVQREKDWTAKFVASDTAWQKKFDEAGKEWRTTIEKQWSMITDLTRAASQDLAEVIEKSTMAWTAVKTLIERGLR